jgi:hypothetical protein
VVLPSSCSSGHGYAERSAVSVSVSIQQKVKQILRCATLLAASSQENKYTFPCQTRSQMTIKRYLLACHSEPMRRICFVFVCFQIDFLQQINHSKTGGTH